MLFDALKTLSVNQPCYLPWCGLLERVARADVHVHLDDVQYVKNSFFNRNRIIDRRGNEIMLTVPVKAKLGTLFRDVQVAPGDWVRKHDAALVQCYGRKDPSDVLPALRQLLASARTSLADLNIALCDFLARVVGIQTPTVRASALQVDGTATQRLVNLCQRLGADTYYSPAGARAYLDVTLFAKANIHVIFQNYVPQPYAQGAVPRFVSNLSVVDLLLRHGAEAARRTIEAGALASGTVTAHEVI